MYTLCKIKGRSHWQVRYKEGNKRVLRSTGTDDKKLAEEFAQKLAADHWRVRRLGDRPRKDWVTAATEYMREKPWVTHNIKCLDPYLRNLYLDEITQDLLSRIRTERRAVVSGTTVNRSVESLRAILAKEGRNGYRTPRLFFERFKERDVIVFLSKEEAERLVRELPEHLAAMAQFSLATGLRESNVTGLEWSQVDMARRTAWIPGPKSKSGKPIQVPLNNEAMVVLRGLQGGHARWVFTYEGSRVRKMNTAAWRKALKRCGLKIRVHDLRHTWASWHVQNGTPLAVVKELGGWSDIKMVMRYAHVGESHIADWAGNVSGLRVVTKVVADDLSTVTKSGISG